MKDTFFTDLEGLVESWCDRRNFTALRYVLKGYPLSSGLTDDWNQLLNALEDVRAFAKDELTESDRLILENLINTIKLDIL